MGSSKCGGTWRYFLRIPFLSESSIKSATKIPTVVALIIRNQEFGGVGGTGGNEKDEIALYIMRFIVMLR